MVESNFSPGFNRPEGYGWLSAIAGRGDAILCTVKYDENYCIVHGGTFKNIILNDMVVAYPNQIHICLRPTSKRSSSPSSSASDSSYRESLPPPQSKKRRKADFPIKLLVDVLRLGVQYKKYKGCRRGDFCQSLDLKGGRIQGGGGGFSWHPRSNSSC